MDNWIIETERLRMRELEDDDFADVCRVLQDGKAMYAYEHAFSDDEVWAWIKNQQRRYSEDGFGLWAVVLKRTERIIGQCGLTIQFCHDKNVVEVGYLFERAVWHNGYATEAAIACRNYAFNTLGTDEVYSIIRNSNIPSQRVAIRNNMSERFSIMKHYYGMDMPHIVFSVKNPNSKQLKR